MRSRYSSTIYFAFVRLLVAGAEAAGHCYSVNELSDKFEISHSTAWAWVRRLRDLDLVYIRKWKRVGKVHVACYAWGFKEDDAPKPAPLTQAQHEKNYRARRARKQQNGVDSILRYLT